VELLNDVRRVLKISGWIPCTIRVVIAGPLDPILDLIPVASRVKDLIYFPLLLLLDDYRTGWRLKVSCDRFCASRCGLEETDVENSVYFDSGLQLQLIGACAHFFEDAVRAYLFVIQLVQGSGCSDVLVRSQTLSPGSSTGSGCRVLLACST